MIKTNNPKSAWKGQSTEEDKPWGSVISWPAISEINGKILKIEKGGRTSLKYNTLKHEVLFLIRGTVIISTWKAGPHPDQIPELRIPLKPGDTFNIQSEIPYRITALEESYIVEISNGKTNQAVIFYDDYGRDSEKS